MLKLGVLFLTIILSACADPSKVDLPPSTFSAGEMKIFVTQKTFTGNLGGIQGADLFCNSDPNRPPGSYKALLVDGVHRSAIPQVDWVIRPTTLYFRGDGITIVGESDANGVFPFPITEAISASSQLVWTGLGGLGAEWSTSTLNCQNWSVGDETSNSEPGDVGAEDVKMINEGITTFCNQNFHLTCVQQ